MTTRLTRRQVLLGAAGASALVAGAGLVRAVDQGVFASWSGRAYEPWDTWRPATFENTASLLGPAIVAASAHNTQPWQFRAGQDTLDVYADATRTLGAMDPALRELHLSVGCAIENIALTAAALGLNSEMTPATEVITPTSTPSSVSSDPIARIALSPSAETATASQLSLFQAIGDRHTDRTAYADQAVSSEQLTALAALATLVDPSVIITWLTAPSDREQFAEETIAATTALIEDEAQSRDSHRWYRSDWDTIQQRADGITLDASGNGTLVRVAGKMLPAVSEGTANKYFLNATKNTHTKAPAFGLICLAQPTSVAERLTAGRAWQRLHLAAVAAGLAAQPLNQVMERADREAQLGAPGRFSDVVRGYAPTGAAVFAFRLGHPTQATHPSPRRPVSEVVLGE